MIEYKNITKEIIYTKLPEEIIKELLYWKEECDKIKKHRLFKWHGRFDGYDVWINYSYKGNSNPEHNHTGFLSGVIYLNNKNDATHFIKDDITFIGEKGDMVLFPSNLKHKVETQQEEYERVTFAFNINKT